MANEGTLQLTLLTVEGDLAKDAATEVTVERFPERDTVLEKTTSFPPSRKFALPAFPQAKALSCLIEPERFRAHTIGVFSLADGETLIHQPRMFRHPKKWSSKFVKWDDLGNPITTLKEILEDSPGLRVRGGKKFDTFTGAAYDDPNAVERTVLAKACLLNLFAKLNTVKEPVFSRKMWFGFVTRIVEIGRERFIAIVEEDMIKRVREIHKTIDDFDGYKRTPVGDHAENIPAGFTFSRSDMVSIKTIEDHGNIQLTMTPAKDASGTAVTLLDADIDENGKLMAHLGDILKHKFTGGTHPFDIHEYLRLEDRTRPLGYELV